MALNTVDPLQDPNTPAPIVQTAMDSTLPQPDAQPVPATEAAPVEPYKAPEVKPVTTQVDAPTETVESRLNTLTAKGSKYTDLARKDTMREANTRGLINSTMAAGAGTEAAIRSALPIAQQDAKTFTDTRMANQAAENTFLKNRQSANLNMEVAGMDSKLKTQFEKTMQDERFSDEAKIQIVTTINSIMTDTQDQITAVGLSDRSAVQQSEAIDQIRRSRDAQIAVYEDLLKSFNDWEWSTDFTPETPLENVAEQTAAAEKELAAAEARRVKYDGSVAPDGTGVHQYGVGAKMSDSEKWYWKDSVGYWVLNEGVH